MRGIKPQGKVAAVSFAVLQSEQYVYRKHLFSADICSLLQNSMILRQKCGILSLFAVVIIEV